MQGFNQRDQEQVTIQVEDVLQLDPTASVELPLNLKPMDLVDLIRQMLPSFRLQGPDREFEIHRVFNQ